jgi:4-alpha-glucanotransferase
MMDRARVIMSAPLPPEYGASGVLLHITPLPLRHGIDDLGRSVRAGIGRLADAGQGWWQSLPLAPAGYGNSPYQPLSTFAGARQHQYGRLAARTIRIFSSAENFRRVMRRMSFTTFSTGSFAGPAFCLIFAP